MRSFFNKRIPTIAGLLLLAIAVLATSYLVNTGVILFGGAAPSDNPQDVRITNISDTSFTVTYKTDAKVIGTISLLTPTTQTILDERDQQSGVPQSYTVHSISVKNTKAETDYTFSITSGATTYQNNGTPFTLKTGPVLTTTPSTVAPFTGKLLDDNGNPPAEALVFVTTTNGQTLSVLTSSQGIYIIPLNAIRSSDASGFLTLNPTSTMQLLATNGKLSSQAQVILSGANPVPLITLGNNYNFLSSGEPLSTTSASLGFPAFPTDNLNATPVIIVPKKDEGFTDNQPQFSGKALPNQPVTVQIHSDDAINATVTTDSNGNWTYRPNQTLSVGQHIISITTKDASGILHTIQQSFTVFASGSQVTQSATPSGKLSVSPTATPTQSVKTIPTVSPTTPTPTMTPTPTKPIVSGTPKPTLPPTGSNSLIVSSLLAVAVSVVGVVLFIVTKGASL